MTDIDAILKELDELEGKATAEPWTSKTHLNITADIALIIALRNHYRALATEIRTQRERVQKLEDGLNNIRFAHAGNGPHCTCSQRLNEEIVMQALKEAE